MTEHYFDPEMDVVEFPNVDVIATSDLAASLPEDTLGTGPGDAFLE